MVKRMNTEHRKGKWCGEDRVGLDRGPEAGGVSGFFLKAPPPRNVEEKGTVHEPLRLVHTGDPASVKASSTSFSFRTAVQHWKKKQDYMKN